MGMAVKNSHRRLLYCQYSAIRGESQQLFDRFLPKYKDCWASVGEMSIHQNPGRNRLVAIIETQLRPFQDDKQRAHDTTDAPADDGKRYTK
jgi:hypothetical protein